MAGNSLPNKYFSLAARTRWYIYIRWFVLMVIIIPGLLTFYFALGWTRTVQRDTILGAVAMASNAVFYLLMRAIKKNSYFLGLSGILLVLDLILVSFTVYINGGVESRSPILYVIPILMSAIIFGRKAIYATTLTAIAIYDSLITADYFGVIHTVGALNHKLHDSLPYTLNSIAFFTSILIIIGIMTDFVTRLLIDREQQVSQSLAALQQAQDIAGFGSWEWTPATDQFWLSDEMRRIFGLRSRATVSHDEFIKRLHPDDQPLFVKRVNRALKNRSGFNFDYRIVRPGGAIRHIRYNGRVVPGRNTATRVIGTAYDVTRAKLLDEARTEFISLASHQLRTPATAVKQYLGLLTEGYAGKLTKDQQEFLATASESNDRQLSIIDDLLNVAQIDSGNIKLNKAKFDLVKLLKTVIEEQSYKFKAKNQKIEFEPQLQQMYVEGDERRLRMVVDNLLDNAYKYSPRGSHTRVGLARRGQRIVLDITDEGVGIAKRDLPRLFQKFSRIDNPLTRQESGTGLGLYLVDKIVKLHNGTVEIESRPKHGTRFRITLPAPRD